MIHLYNWANRLWFGAQKTSSKIEWNFHWYDVLGWLGTVLVLLAYASGSAFLFALSNTLLWPLVILPSVIRRAWSAAAISFTFGMIGTYTVLTH